jgi:hypothetical protein
MVPVVDVVEMGLAVARSRGSTASTNWASTPSPLAHRWFRQLMAKAARMPPPSQISFSGASLRITSAPGSRSIPDMEAVGCAIEPISSRLDLSPKEVARSIVRIANDNMVNALKLVSLSRSVHFAF